MKTQIISEVGDIVYFINPEADNLAFSSDMTLQMRGELVEIGEEDNLVRLLGEEEEKTIKIKKESLYHTATTTYSNKVKEKEREIYERFLKENKDNNYFNSEESYIIIFPPYSSYSIAPLEVKVITKLFLDKDIDNYKTYYYYEDRLCSISLKREVITKHIIPYFGLTPEIIRNIFKENDLQTEVEVEDNDGCQFYFEIGEKIEDFISLNYKLVECRNDNIKHQIHKVLEPRIDKMITSFILNLLPDDIKQEMFNQLTEEGYV
jgi:hypothetical protein